MLTIVVIWVVWIDATAFWSNETPFPTKITSTTSRIWVLIILQQPWRWLILQESLLFGLPSWCSWRTIDVWSSFNVCWSLPPCRRISVGRPSVLPFGGDITRPPWDRHGCVCIVQSCVEFDSSSLGHGVTALPPPPLSVLATVEGGEGDQGGSGGLYTAKVCGNGLWPGRYVRIMSTGR